MRTIRVARSLSDNTDAGGYICRTIAKGFMDSAPIHVRSNLYHKPYQLDWAKAKEKAINKCLKRDITEGGTQDGTAAN